MRTIVELPDEQLRSLDSLRKRLGISRAEAIRRALHQYLAREADTAAEHDRAFGLWAAYPGDPAEEVSRLRDAWDDRLDRLHGRTGS